MCGEQMTFLTIEQYQKYFSCDENTLILGSPQIALIADLLGEKFAYASTIDDVNKKYDRVLIDVEEGKQYRNIKQKTEKTWYNDAVKCLSKTGVLIGAFPRKVCSSFSSSTQAHRRCVIKQSGYDITMIENDRMIVKNNSQSLSTIQYGNKTITLDTKKVPILHKYNEKHYNYLMQTDLSKSIEKYSLPGKKIRNIEGDKKEIKEMGKEGLLIFTNCRSLKVIKLEDVDKLSSAADCHLFPSVKERDLYYNALLSPKVQEFAMNLSHYQPINVKMRSYLFNPNIFSL
jgi:hypothetical protein